MLVDKISAKMDGIGPLLSQNYKKTPKSIATPKPQSPKREKENKRKEYKAFNTQQKT